MRVWDIPCIVLILIAAISTTAWAEETEETRRWNDTAEFAMVQTTGNSESTTISAFNKFGYAWNGNAEITVNAAFLRAENTTVDRRNVGGTPVITDTEETTTNNYGLDSTYRHTINDGFLWYINAGWARDKIKAIADRYTSGGGLGYRFLQSDDHKLVGEFGASWTDETRVDDARDSFGDARAFLGYEQALSKTSSLTSELEILENIEDTDDLRFKAVTSVTARLNSKMALKVTSKIEYDRQPVVITLVEDPPLDPPSPDVDFEFDSTDTMLAASLVINF